MTHFFFAFYYSCVAWGNCALPVVYARSHSPTLSVSHSLSLCHSPALPHTLRSLSSCASLTLSSSVASIELDEGSKEGRGPESWGELSCIELDECINYVKFFGARFCCWRRKQQAQKVCHFIVVASIVFLFFFCILF